MSRGEGRAEAFVRRPKFAGIDNDVVEPVSVTMVWWTCMQPSRAQIRCGVIETFSFISNKDAAKMGHVLNTRVGGHGDTRVIFITSLVANGKGAAKQGRSSH
ncbi:hypothetical protein RIF29_20055 [Crotalaria pallida]|uniref:Uncharacterized protein n=1 Tax=Crotalaria pallida TaxID=3830 RepID=A0AAN9I4N9_CROPI